MDTYKIYKITFPNGTHYIGQTRKHVYQRWASHLNEVQYGKHLNPRIQEVYDEYGYDDWVFEVIQTEVSDDTSYIALLEHHHIKETPNTLNRSYLTDEERKEKANIISKKYYSKNKEERLEYQREYYKKNMSGKRLPYKNYE